MRSEPFGDGAEDDPGPDEDYDGYEGPEDDEGPEDEDGEDGGGAGPRAASRPVSWTNRFIIGFAVVVLLVAGGLIAASLVPRWWAERVGQACDGSLAAGIFVGLACGAVFTAAPLTLLRRVVRRRTRWGARLALLALAALAASPNLMTLGVAVGSGPGSRAGAAILDADAPGFGGATLAGAVLGVLAVLGVWSMLAGRRRRRRELAGLRAELRRHEEGSAEEDG